MNRNIALILSTVFTLFAAQTMISVLIPLEAADIGLDTSVIGLLVAIPLAVGFVTDIPFARASDTFGRRPALTAGGLVGLIAGAILAIGSGGLLLVVGSLLFGVALSMLVGPTLAFLTEVASPASHAHIQAVNGAIQGISALVGAAAVGAVTTQWGSSPAFAVTGFLMLVVVGHTTLLREPGRGVAQPGSVCAPNVVQPFARAFELLFQQPALLIAAAAAVLYGLIFLIVGNAFIPVYLITQKEYSTGDAGALLALRSLIAALTSLPFGYIAPRTGIIILVVMMNAVGVVGLGLVPLLADSPLLAGAFILQGAGIAFGPATANLLITAATTEAERAIGFSSTMLAARLTGVLFPVLLGTVAGFAGFDALFLVTAVIGVLMIAFIMIVARSGTANVMP